MTKQTKREQVEAVLRAAGLVEDDHGDWRLESATMGTYVYLDIAHAPPETAWVTRWTGGRVGRAVPREVITYDELMRRFSQATTGPLWRGRDLSRQETQPLRPYQADAIGAAREGVSAGRHAICLVMG